MGQFILKGFLLGTLLLGVGCVRCQYRTFQESLRTFESCDVHAPQRNRVYAFVLTDAWKLLNQESKKLSLALAREGYPKIYTALRADQDWYEREVDRLLREDPGAKIVLVGYGQACQTVREVQARLARRQINVHTLIEIDPENQTNCTILCRHVLIRSSLHQASRKAVADEVHEIEGVGHPALLSHVQTVGIIAQVMHDWASTIPAPPIVKPSLPLREKADPIPRPHLATPPETIVPGWEFMLPIPGGVSSQKDQQ